MISKLKTPAALAAVLAVALVGVVAAWAITSGSDDDDDDLTTVTAAATETQADPEADTDEIAAVDPDDAAGAEPVVDPEDEPLTSAELKRVEAAALKAAGGGDVVDVSRSDDVGEAYEIEVLTDAGEVDVALDERFQRVPNAAYED